MNLTQNRGAGDSGKYALCGHPQGGLTMLEVNALYDLAKILALGSEDGHFQIQRFKTVVPAASTDDVTFTDTVQGCDVLGGWVKITGVDADYDFDVGHEGTTTAFVNDLIVKIGDEVDGEVPVEVDYIGSEDVMLTITSNSNTVPVTVEIALLTSDVVQS